MTTPAKVEANRQNARRSTGPRTPSGKAASRLNAVRHGLLARPTVLPDEDEREFRRLLDRLDAESQPVGVLEETCVERIADAIWRLRRARRIENDIFVSEMYGAEQAHGAVASGALLLALKFGQGLSEEDKVRLELQARRQLADQERQLEAAVVGIAFSRDAGGPEALTKLSRYEVAIERSLFRNLEELRRLQADRGRA